MSTRIGIVLLGVLGAILIILSGPAAQAADPSQPVITSPADGSTVSIGHTSYSVEGSDIQNSYFVLFEGDVECESGFSTFYCDVYLWIDGARVPALCTPDEFGDVDCGSTIVGCAGSDTFDSCDIEPGTFWINLTEQEAREVYKIDILQPHDYQVSVVSWELADGSGIDFGQSADWVPSESPLSDPVRVTFSAGLTPTTPSGIHELDTIATLGLTPARAVATAGLTLVLGVVVGLPSTLLTSTISANYKRLFGWTGRLGERFPLFARKPYAKRSWLELAGGVVAAAIITGFVDPDFGFNLGSLRLVISLIAAFAVLNLLGSLVVRIITGRMGVTERSVTVFRWGSLVILLFAVIVSRILGFEPGFVFGLVMGLTFAAQLALAHQTRVVLVGAGFAIVVSLVAWVLYSLGVWGFGDQPGFVGLLVIETLAAIVVGGLAALPIALLPLEFLDGRALFKTSRWLWAGAYFVGLFVFLTIVLPLPSSTNEVQTSWSSWIVALFVYAVLAVLAWLVFTIIPARRRKKTVAAS